jgi:hypothetical protein
MNTDEIDGGITYVDGQYKQIVLNARGCFLRLEDPKKSFSGAKVIVSALDVASEEAKNKMPAALTLAPTPEALALAQMVVAPVAAPVDAPAFKMPT